MISENTKRDTTMHATTHNVYQYQGTNREDLVTFVPVQTKVTQRTLPNTENLLCQSCVLVQKKERKKDN